MREHKRIWRCLTPGFLAFVLGFVAVPIAANAAPMQVLGSAPQRNTTALRAASVSITFDKPVIPATITTNTFRVFGRVSGAKAGTFT